MCRANRDTLNSYMKLIAAREIYVYIYIDIYDIYII